MIMRLVATSKGCWPRAMCRCKTHRHLVCLLVEHRQPGRPIVPSWPRAHGAGINLRDRKFSILNELMALCPWVIHRVIGVKPEIKGSEIEMFKAILGFVDQQCREQRLNDRDSVELLFKMLCLGAKGASRAGIAVELTPVLGRESCVALVCPCDQSTLAQYQSRVRPGWRRSCESVPLHTRYQPEPVLRDCGD